MNLAKLRGLMAENGMTQKDVAQLLEINENTFKKKILGKSKFSFEEVVKLSKIFKVDINIFLK